MTEKRNTLQKEIIYSTLRRMHNHPTASMVYEKVYSEHPTISRSTVYRVLAQMAEDGSVLRLGLAGSDDRYDASIHRHGHVRCRMCGAVADIPGVTAQEPDDTAGYLLEDWIIEYKGLCPECRRSANGAFGK